MMFCRDEDCLYLSMQLHTQELFLTVSDYRFSPSKNGGKNYFKASNTEGSLE